MNITDAYQQVRRLIRHTASDFIRLCPREWEDIIAEADLAFCEAFKLWRPERAALTTWVGRVVRWRLAAWLETHITHQRERHQEGNPIEDRHGDWSFPDLSDDARSVAELALSWPSRFRPGKQQIKTELLSKGWSKNRVYSAFKEIQELV